ncbi:MAG: hypothetical protein EOO75_19745, partial [Myxococcales bacterium]
MAARTKPPALTLPTAVAAIDARHALMVFPADNAPDPPSLWSHFYPREPLRWVWEEDSGDNRVWQLWHLRPRLSTSRRVIYTKWYRDRPIVLSLELAAALLAALGTPTAGDRGLSAPARQILESLDDNSPQSPRELRLSVDLVGGDHERVYTRALRELWQRMLIVGFGEVADGAFPSLALGSTRILFEDLWSDASQLDPAAATVQVRQLLAGSPRLLAHFERTRRALSPEPAEEKAAPARETRRAAPKRGAPKAAPVRGSRKAAPARGAPKAAPARGAPKAAP